MTHLDGFFFQKLDFAIFKRIICSFFNLYFLLNYFQGLELKQNYLLFFKL
jgi:hypothetical protein